MFKHIFKFLKKEEKDASPSKKNATAKLLEQDNKVRFSDYVHLESQVANQDLNELSPELLAKFEEFKTYVKDKNLLNVSLFAKSESRFFYNALATYITEFKNFNQQNSEPEAKSRFLSLMRSVDVVFKKRLFDSHGNINLEALALIDFFLNEIFYTHQQIPLIKGYEVEPEDLTQILAEHFDDISAKNFYQTYVQSKYQDSLFNLINLDIESVLGKDTEFFDQRLPFLILVDAVRKTTFLPLSYHEMVQEFFSDYVSRPKDQLHFLEMRRQVITQQTAFVNLLVTEYLTIKAYEFDLITPSYFADVDGVISFREKISKIPDMLFTYLLLARRKSNSDKIFLHEKDMLLLKRIAYLCESEIDYRELYLYLKHVGL